MILALLRVTLLLACSDLKVDYGGAPTSDDGGTTDGGTTDGGTADGGTADGGSETAAGWAWGEDVPVAEADVALVGGTTENDGVSYVITPGDVDGDGISDLLISAAAATAVIDHTEIPDAGRIFLVHGAAEGWEASMSLAGRPGVQGNEEHNQLNTRGTLGDVTGDGLADYPVNLGWSASDPPGLPGLVAGGPGASTLRALDELDWIAGADPDATGTFDGLQGLGDIDGDGVGDLLLTDWSTRELVVVHGGALDDLASLPSDADLYLTLGEWEVYDSGRGDVTGDGRTDLVLKVAETGRERFAVLWSPASSTASEGELLEDEVSTRFVTTGELVSGLDLLADVDGDGIGELLFSGEAAGSAGTSASWLVSGADVTGTEVVVDELGIPVFPAHGGGGLVAVGDSDGDGLRDMLSERSPLEPTFVREVVLVPGRSGGWGEAMEEDAVATSLRIYESGDSTSGLPDRGLHGDIDGDGMDDIVLGAASYDRDGLEDAGQVRIFLGGTAWPTFLDQHDADARFHGEVEDALVGHTFEVVDMNGDGFDDVVIGAWNPLPESEGGATFIFFGQPYSTK